MCYTDIGDPKNIIGPIGHVTIDIRYSKCNERKGCNEPVYDFLHICILDISCSRAILENCRLIDLSVVNNSWAK